MILTAFLLAAAQPAAPAATPPAAPSAPALPTTPPSSDGPRLQTDANDPMEPPAALGEAWMRCFGEHSARLIRAGGDGAVSADEAGRNCPEQEALIRWTGTAPRPREALGHLAFLFFYMRELVIADEDLIRNPLPDTSGFLPPEPPGR